MGINSRRFPRASRVFGGDRATWTRLGRRAAATLVLLLIPGAALAAAVTVKGKTAGAQKLMNPVWNEAKDPKLQRYTFREPSASVRSDVHTLTAFLPKELCIVALGSEDAKPLSGPIRVVLAGGRTTPVTLVITKGQQVQFENNDPFAHKLYVVGTDNKGFGPVETGPTKTRGWTPPGPGKYEIRDQLAPSLRSWIVVEPKAQAINYPDRKGDFQLDLQPGTYKLRGYFNGEPAGSELEVTVTGAPAEQLLKAPLVVAEGAPDAGSGG